MQKLKTNLKGRVWEGARITGSLVLISAVGLLAAGCGSTSNTSSSSRTTLNVWRLNQDKDVLQSAITDFQNSNKGYTVEYKKGNLSTYELASLKALAAQTGPDVWSIPSDWLGDYSDMLVSLPSNYFKDKSDKAYEDQLAYFKSIYPTAIANAALSDDGKSILGVPGPVDTLQLYYNTDIFSNATSEFRKSLGNNYSDSAYEPVRTLLNHAPTTWSELTDQVKYLTQKNGTTITRSAIALGTADNVPDSADILQWLMVQNGVKIISDDRETPLFNQTESTPAGATVRPGEKALSFYASFADPSSTNYTWNPSMPSALDAFGQGKVAMVIAYSSFGKDLKVKYPKFTSYTVTTAPQIAASTVQTPVVMAKFYLETATKAFPNSGFPFAFLRRYTDLTTINSIAREAKLTSPGLQTSKDATAGTAQSGVQYATTVFKRNHVQFDTIFRRMITDVSQNGISSGLVIDGGAEDIRTIMKTSE